MELVRQWTDWLEVADRSPSTIHQYRLNLLTFLEATLLDLTEVTHSDVVRHLKGLTTKAGTKALRLRSLQSFYRWAVKRRFVVEDPTEDIPTKRKHPGPAPYNTEDELIRVFLAAWAHRPMDPRRAPTVMFLYGTGARIESACSVLPEDVYPGEVHFRVAKGDRPYRLPLGPTAQWAVDELLHLREYVNPRTKTRLPTLIGVGAGRVWQWVNDASRESGVKTWPHLMRHTFGTVVAHTAQPAEWADLMNHADLSQYRRYAGVYEERKRASVAGV